MKYIPLAWKLYKTVHNTNIFAISSHHSIISLLKHSVSQISYGPLSIWCNLWLPLLLPWSSFFECWVLSWLSSICSFTFIKKLFSSFSLLPEWWCHLHIWVYWYFSRQCWFQLVLHPARHFAWCILHLSWINRVTIYSLDILLSQFWNSLSFHVWF